MLNYFINVTNNLIMPAILLGLLYAYIPVTYGARVRKILNIGTIAGFAFALTLAILKHTTKIIDKTGDIGMWNVYIFAVSTVALILFYIFSLKGTKKGTYEKNGTAVAVFGAILICTYLTYSFTSVFDYPFEFKANGDAVFSTAYIYRVIGYVLGILLCLIIFAAVYQVEKRMGQKMALIVMNIILLINGLQFVSVILRVLHAKRIISGHGLFQVIKFTSNHEDWFVYAAMIVVFIVPIALWIKSFNVKEPYSNPAHHRKIRAKWRNIRRWSTLLFAGMVMVVVTMTAITAYATKEVELSPVEECELREDACYIPFSQVEDGHLHRFAYTTDDGIDVRFIIIKKPNSSAYGIGLDACDICGETGYYEKNEQVVCNLCDVVMNINTIGFKGGCNPIVIDYSIENGYIVIPFSTLVEHQDEFK